jgi:hypothetical protein
MPKKTTTLDGRLPFNAATTEAAIPIPPLSNAAQLADCFKVSFVFALFSQCILFFLPNDRPSLLHPLFGDRCRYGSRRQHDGGQLVVLGECLYNIY